MRMDTRIRARSQRGVAMVEFAITLPLLLLLLLGIAEIGRLLFQYNSLQQANRDAVRYVASQAWNSTLGQVQVSTDLLNKTKNVAVYGVPVASGQPLLPGLTTTAVQVAAVGTDHVRVSISYTFVPVIGSGIPALVGSAIPLGFPLVATSVMRAL